MKSLINSTVGDIAVICGGRLESGDPEKPVFSVTNDSRESDSGSLFIPIIGEKFDGHSFIPDICFKGGASACLTQKNLSFENENSSTAIIRCDDTLRALGYLASHHRRMASPFVIGITGTNGKTTTKELMGKVISSKYRCLKNEKNYNNEIGVPFTLLNIRPEHEYAVIEMGMNHAGEINRLSRMASPDMTVITSIGEGHLEYLKSVENIARAKSEIFNGAKPGSTALINRDTKCYEILAQRAARAGLAVLSYGLSEHANFRPQKYSLAPDSFTMTIEGVEITVPLFGIHNLYNSLAAVYAGISSGISLELIAAALSEFSNVSGRGGAIDAGFLLIDDTYNSNPLSAKAAIESAAAVYKNLRKVAALGDMRELGDSAEGLHEATGRLTAESGFAELCLFGEMARCYKKGALAGGMDLSAVKIFDTREEMASYLKGSLKRGDVVLVKGSRSTRMDEVVKNLTGANRHVL